MSPFDFATGITFDGKPHFPCQKQLCDGADPATGQHKAGPTYRFSFSWLSVPLVNDLPQFFGSEGHLNVCLTQRICHSGGNCRSRANRTRLTNSLHTQWVDGRWCHRMVKLEDW